MLLRLIPPQLINCQSNAERKVFSFLQQISFSQYDVALHSLNIGKHEYKRWGEADFVLIGKRGILLLEVKGGRVACKDGLWEFKDRFGDATTKKESPAAQAKTAFFSLEKNYLKKQFGRELGGVPAGWGVVFTDIDRLINVPASLLPEHPDEITAYEDECRGHNVFKGYLERVFDHWDSLKSNPRHLSPEVVKRIVQFLRPNFEKIPSLNSQLQNSSRDLCQFTDEQYEKLDEISENDRIMVVGGAGTGKTFVAAACARYEAAEGRSVLLVTRSPFLASFLSSHDLPPSVVVMTMEEVWSLADPLRQWDTLIVDEGQDLSDLESIDRLGKVLTGGWEQGRWRWFGDPNHQVSPSFPVDDVALEFLSSLAVRQRLKKNVRNASAVVDAIKVFSGADVGKATGRAGAGKVRTVEASGADDISVAVVNEVRAWLKGEDSSLRGEIVVLTGSDAAPEVLADCLTQAGIRSEALSERALGGKSRDCVLVAKVEDFKGLERPLVCVAGLGSDPGSYRRVAYKAISRANHEVVIVSDAASFSELAKAAAQDAADKSGVSS